MTQNLIASSEHRVVVGLGVTGLSCARYLYARGLAFTVVDTRTDPPGLQDLQREMPEVAIFAGDIPAEIIQSASEVIVSPGIAIDDPVVRLARDNAVTIVGDVDLFMREAQAPVVGITGSNAKSTVTELLGAMARRAGLNTGVGGNLGTPALELLDAARELYVLELSSFQLERAGELGLSVATVLNVSADHLDRHGSMPAYHQAKHRIFRGCSKVVVNRDDPLTIALVAPEVEVISWRMREPELRGFGLRQLDGQEWIYCGFEPLLAVADLQISGRHNVANALAALALGTAAGIALPAMLATLREFRGLPHRCELVAEVGAVRFVNDSKGTNVGATQAALEGLGGDRDIVLIAGGQAKGADFRPLQAAVRKHCKALVLLGQDAEQLESALAECAPVVHATSMAGAVSAASALAGPGDSVLLSPACASFDMFSGYVQRGDAFSAAVANVQEGAS